MAFRVLCACLLLHCTIGLRAHVGAHDGNITIFFGSGCFFGRQHDFATFERDVLGRADAELTAVAGFAGSVDTAPGGQVCYHNANNTADYAQLGHAEAVQLKIPPSSLAAAAAVFFSSFIEYAPGLYCREDYFDQGPAYRALVGLPGGVHGSYFGQLRAANKHNMTLVESSAGSDADTFEQSKVFVMDSDRFTFHQADLCLQFHDNVTGHYTDAYHNLKNIFLQEGRLHDTKCPQNIIC